jgi:hypothetical protein
MIAAIALFLTIGVSAASADENRIGKFFVNEAVSSGSVVELVAPSANTDGMWIRSCSLSLTQANTGSVLFVSATAPSSPGDLTTRALMNFFAGAPGSQNCPHAVYVEPGNGVWVGDSGAGGVYLTYDLLQ